MSSKKAGGVTAQNKGRPGKRLGLKKYGGQTVLNGQIIIRQRGTKVKAGSGVGTGRDHTLYATRKGKITYRKQKGVPIVMVE